jgi:RND superfamily putative drug exporter
VFREVGEQVEADLARAEAIAVPITLVLLVLVFASAVAGALPLAVGGFAIVGTLLVLRVLAEVTDVSIYALNLTTALGLGLAIDYSLFIVSRYREELRAGRETGRRPGRDHAHRGPHGAVQRGHRGRLPARPAGVPPLLPALRSATPASPWSPWPRSAPWSCSRPCWPCSAAGSTGSGCHRPAGRRGLATGSRGPGFWHRMATSVMRRPVPDRRGRGRVLVLLGSPFLGVRFGLPDDRVLPAGAQGRQVAEAVRANFAATRPAPCRWSPPGSATRPPTWPTSTLRRRPVPAGRGRPGRRPHRQLRRRPAAPGPPAHRRRRRAARGPALRRRRRHLAVGGRSVEPYSAAGEDLVAAVRHSEPRSAPRSPARRPSWCDTKASLSGNLPAAGAVIALVTFALLFLMTGSVVIPVKALVLNLLSLTAVYGAMVFDLPGRPPGRRSRLHANGTIDTSMPVLLFCIAFGLSMDYEVFLLSRIKEEHDRTGDNVASVAAGLERTGRIVTTAAALLAIVFVAFATSEVSFLKLFGIGTALAILVDATLIRALLVPAFMRLAGRANWWGTGAAAPPARPVRAARGPGGERGLMTAARSSASSPPGPGPAGERARACARRSWPPPPDCWPRPATRRRSPSAPWPRPSASPRPPSTCTSPTRPS